MTEDQLRLEYYKDFCTQMDNAFLENQKAYDQAILTLSSGSIAALLAFIQGRVVENLTYFYWAFSCFGSAIIVTLISFLLAQKIVDKKKAVAHKYFVERDEAAYNERPKLDIIHEYMGVFCAVTFILAVVFSVRFIINNPFKGDDMSKNTKVQINEGFTGAVVNRLPLEVDKRGFTGPSMTQIPTQTVVVTPAAPAPTTVVTTPAPKTNNTSGDGK